MNTKRLTYCLALPIIILIAGLSGCNALIGALVELPEFSENETDGWYHRNDREIWLQKGARPDVVDKILHRIETADGPRHDPEVIDSIIEFGPGHWVYEWQEAGLQTFAAAKNAQESEALLLYQEALAYFTTASWPHLGLDDDRQALELAREVYGAIGEILNSTVEHVVFDVDGKSTGGWLHLPSKEGPHPFLIFTYGSDNSKEDGLNLFVDVLEPLGIGLLTVDFPGLGESTAIRLQDGSDQALKAARNYLSSRPEVDQAGVFVGGASFGGNAAGRYFLDHKVGEVAGVIYMCGPLHIPFQAPASVLDKLPKLTVDGVKARLGVYGQPTSEVVGLAKQLSVEEQGLTKGDKNIETPLLVITTNEDPVAPLDDLALLENRAVSVDRFVIDQVGHCPDRAFRRVVAANWIHNKLRSRS